MRVYRYFDLKGGLATLQQRQMRLANPGHFNDPFELTPRVEPAKDDVIVQRLSSEEWIKRYYDEIGKENGLTEELSREEYLAKVLPSRIEQVIATKEERAKMLRVSILEHAAKRFRLLCCNLNRESILMWSHYADKHRGIVLEIETDELVEGLCIDSGIIEVRYRASPPMMPALENTNELQDARMLEVMGTKALQWSYEEEVRILFPLQNEPTDDRPIELAFNPACIKKVIVGCNLSPNSAEYKSVDTLADDSAYKHAEFQRAYIHSHDYKLCFATRPR